MADDNDLFSDPVSAAVEAEFYARAIVEYLVAKALENGVNGYLHKDAIKRDCGLTEEQFLAGLQYADDLNLLRLGK
jgi:hypothetical protein